MKINKLRIKNINSLKNEHFIDFTVPPLSNSGLFAITGPTGSGKTTILDAICLSLFNRIPRINAAISRNIIEETGIVLTKNAKEAFSEVEFSCSQGVYTTRWEITTNRNGNLRDYEMRLFDQNGNVIEEKKTIVPARVEHLIGLNFEQFTRSIMLPQGDFAQFLKSGKHDRGKLLEKITGSFIYRQLGQKAYQKSQEVKNAIENSKRRIDELELQKMDDDDFIDLNAKCDLIEKEQFELQEQLTKTKKQLEIKHAVQQLSLEIDAAKKWHNETSQALYSFNETSGVKLDKHQQLSPYFSTINTIQQLQKQIENNTLKCSTLETQQLENLDKLTKISEKISNFTSKLEILSGNRLTDLDLYEKHVKGLLAIRQQKEFEYRTGYEPLARFAKEMSIEISMKEEPQKIAEKISLRKQSTLYLLAELEQKYPQIGQEANTSYIEILNSHSNQINEWDKADALLKEHVALLDGIEKKQEELAQDLIFAKSNIVAFTTLYEETKVKFELKSKDLVISKLQAKLEDVRQQLEIGEPCPVCGSTDHPWAGKTIKEPSTLEMEVATSEKAKVSAKTKLDSENTRLIFLEKQISSINSELSEVQTKIDNITQKINQLISCLPDNLKNFPPVRAAEMIKKQSIDYQKYISLRSDLEKIESIKSQISQLILLFVEGKEIREQIVKIYQGNSIETECQELRECYIQIESEKKRISDNIIELKQEFTQTSQNLQKIIHDLMPSINTLGYESVENAMKNILPHDDFTSLINKRQAIEQNLTAAKSKLDTLTEQWQQIKKLDIDVDEKELADRVESDSHKLKTLVVNRDTIKEQLSNQTNIRKELERFVNELNVIRNRGEKWILLNEILGDATGNKFNNFAQSLTLKHLINRANRRLIELNPRYRLAITEKSDDDAILVVDMDMGNQTRSVKTLSGGETFLVSLALALGLADMASRNITIGSLFIDEGFGTLDPETLDQALAMLESLQAKGNKTIGIISHVETLKERINARIDLVPVVGHGYSKIVMIP